VRCLVLAAEERAPSILITFEGKKNRTSVFASDLVGFMGIGGKRGERNRGIRHVLNTTPRKQTASARRGGRGEREGKGVSRDRFLALTITR